MTPERRQILIVAGEASGDLHASGLVREFKRAAPDFHFFGCGGDRMAAEGCEILFHIRDLSFLGLAEVLRHLPFLRRMMRRLVRECTLRKPAAVVLVDYPGFNLRFAKWIRSNPDLKAIPVLYYISPQVWAWRADRVPVIARLVDRMAVIFDFETDIYRSAGLQTDFVGHPLLEVARAGAGFEQLRNSFEIPLEAPLLVLLPGSREQEVKRLLPLFLDTFRLLLQDFPRLKALVGCAATVRYELYQEISGTRKFEAGQLSLVKNRTYDSIAAADVVLAASGTVTLETAIIGTPLVMAYRVSPITYWFGKHLVKIPDIALVNVVAGKRIVPEFIQKEADPEKIGKAIAVLLQDPSLRSEMKSEFAAVRAKLGEPGSSVRTARILFEMIREKGNP
jgi:lipid-A-disaccharide synthase